MQKAYTIETSDIIIPLTELLGKCYVSTDPHPLMQFEKIANLALRAARGQVKQVPVLEVLQEISGYQGREEFNLIADYMVKLWARFVFFMTPIQEDLYRTQVTIISISAGDLRLVFDKLDGGTANDRFDI